MSFRLLPFLLFAFIQSCDGQEIQKKETGLRFLISENATNADELDEKIIIQLWKDYLENERPLRRNTPQWSYENTTYPDANLVNLYFWLKEAKQEKLVQANVLGLFPVENEHFEMKTMFSTIDEADGTVNLEFIITVFAKKENDEYRLVGAPEYYKSIWEKKTVGKINYYLHPLHEFNEIDAKKNSDFNKEIAATYEIEPLSFDYFVSNYSRELAPVLGMDYMQKLYQKVQSGGMADVYNRIVFAGNNSEYYPHEVVHLYHFAKFRQQSHRWFDEGVAAYWGGSSGYSIEWHLQKLKAFFETEPDYPITDDFRALEINIPNGEYTTNFMYAIGGLIAKNIYEKEGMQGLFDALSAGRQDDDYFRVLKEKFGVERADFGKYVKSEASKLEFDED